MITIMTMAITIIMATASSTITTRTCSRSSLKTDKPLNPDKFFPWIQDLVAKDGPNILRCKGILSFKDDPERFVFQGVHMILDGDHQRPWKEGEERDSRTRLHRPQSAGGENPRRASRAAWLRERCRHAD